MDMTESIRVLIVDDEDIVRSGLHLMLDSQADLTVVGEAADGDEAVAQVARLRPDVVLMDIQMPGTDGLEATRRITTEVSDAADQRSVRVIILTTFELDEYVYDALRAGASGFLLKRIRPEELVEAIRVVSRGEALLAPSVTRRLIAHFAQRPEHATVAPAELERLTDRERDVLAEIARGLSNAEISGRLFVSEQTVKTHIKHIFTKLDLRDRAQAVVFAYESGVVLPGQ
jgi:DNA-binding NarL/FixJ family response regulator